MTDQILDDTLTANPDSGASQAAGDSIPGEQATTPNGDSGQQTTPAQAPGTQTPAKLPPRAQNYVGEQVRKRYDAERRAEAAEAAFRALTEQVNAERAKRPQTSDPATVLQYQMRDAVDDSVTRLQRQTVDSARAEATEVGRQVWNSQVQDARQRMPDFDTVTAQPNLAISPVMADTMQSMEDGADVYYYLGKNPGVAEDIFSLPAARQPIAIARLVAKLQPASAVIAAQTSKAPAPVPTVTGGSGAGAKRLADMGMEEYIAARNKGQTA
jgi:hypothetical protein